MLDDPNPEPIPVDPEAIAALRSAQMMMTMAGAPEDVTSQFDQLIGLAERGELTGDEAGVRVNALLASVLGDVPGPFVPTLGEDPSQALGLPELEAPAPSEVPELPALSPDAGVPETPPQDVAELLARAGLAGQYVVLTPAEALDLADLAAFASYAREALYPVILGLQPLVQRIAAVGEQLQDAGPAQLAGLVLGSFVKPQG